MDPFRRDIPVLLSGIPHLNPIVLKINFKYCWENKSYPKILKLYVSFLWEFSYNENADKKISV